MKLSGAIVLLNGAGEPVAAVLEVNQSQVCVKQRPARIKHRPQAKRTGADMPQILGSFLEVLPADGRTADRADKMAAYDRLHAGPERRRRTSGVAAHTANGLKSRVKDTPTKLEKAVRRSCTTGPADPRTGEPMVGSRRGSSPL